MLIKSPSPLASYIASLELAAPQESSLKRARVLKTEETDDAEAFVDASSVVSFVGGVPLLRSQDVLNATLLAQLAANKQFDRETQTEEWYGFYRTVLENVGWVVESLAFSRFASGDATIRLDHAALAILRAIMSGDELQILEATLTALENLPENDGALTLFDSQSSSSEAGNFQLGTVTVDPHGNAVMSLGAFYFKSKEHKGRFLFVRWGSSSINFYTSSQKMILNDQIYSTARQAIIDKLGDAAEKFVLDLVI